MSFMEAVRCAAAIGGIGIILFLSAQLKHWAREEQRRRGRHV